MHFMWFKHYLTLFLYGFFHVVAASYSADISLDMPPAKKQKLQDQERNLPPAYYRGEEIRGRNLSMLRKIKNSGADGCHYRDLLEFLGQSKQCESAVVENVVDAMFREDMDILYNFPKHKFWFIGPAPKVDRPPDLRIALVDIMTDPLQRDDACKNLGRLAYNLFKKGCRAQSYYDFSKKHGAMRVLCDLNLTQDLTVARDIIIFAKQYPPPLQNADKIPNYYAAQCHVHTPAFAKSVAKYILSDLEPEIVTYITRKKRDATGPNREDSRDGTPAHQGSTDVCFGLSTMLEKEEANVFLDEPLEVAMALVMKERSMLYFEDILRFEAFMQSRRGVAIDELRGAFYVVKIICYGGDCSLREGAYDFEGFVKKKAWDAKTTMLEKKDLYEKSCGCVLRQNRFLAGQTLLKMRPEVRERLSKIKIPALGVCGPRPPVCEHSSAKIEPKPEKRPRLPSDHSLSGIKGLDERVKELADQKATCALSDLSKRYGKSDITCLRFVLDSVFKQGLDVDINDRNDLTFSLKRERTTDLFLPIGVMLAMRFLGTTCAPKDRAICANAVYKAGYPIKTYDDFNAMLDVVCVACNVPTNNMGAVEGARCFLSYIQNSPEKKTLAEFQKSYQYGSSIGSVELALIEKANRLQQTDFFRNWMIHAHFRSLTAQEYLGQRETFLVKVLQEYANRHKECPSEVLSVFLVVTPSCADRAVLSLVMQAVLKNKLNIKYNKDRKTYALCAGCDDRPQPEKPMKSFIAEKILNDEVLDAPDMAYALYDAGYRMSSYKQAADLYHVMSVLCSAREKSVVDHWQPFLAYTIRKMPLASENYYALYGQFQKKRTQQSTQDFAFAECFLRLCNRQYISTQEADEIFSGNTWFQRECRKNVTEPVPAQQTEDVVSVAHNSQAEAVCTKTDVEEADRVQCDVKQRHKSFKPFARDAAKKKQALHYKDIAPYAGTQNPEEILEFVMDFVFRNNVSVLYSKEKQDYLFSFAKKKDNITMREGVASLVTRACADKVCSIKERAECAYVLHMAGYSYKSFQHYSSKAFSPICVFQEIPVFALNDITRCQKFWRYGFSLAKTKTVEEAFKDYRAIGGELSEDEEKIVEKALVFRLESKRKK